MPRKHLEKYCAREANFVAGSLLQQKGGAVTKVTRSVRLRGGELKMQRFSKEIAGATVFAYGSCLLTVAVR